MNRILTVIRLDPRNPGFIAHMLQRLVEADRTYRDAKRLADMPREYMKDMGLTRQSDANHRSGGAADKPPHATLW